MPYICLIQAADPRSDPGFRDGRDLVHHQPTGRAQAVPRVGGDGEAKQRRLSFVRRENAEGDRVGGIETILLEDDRWAWLARIPLAAGDGPNLAPPHASPQSVTASMNA